MEDHLTPLSEPPLCPLCGREAVEENVSQVCEHCLVAMKQEESWERGEFIEDDFDLENGYPEDYEEAE